jgi:membrane protein
MGSRAEEFTLKVMEVADGISTGLVGTLGFALLLWTLLGTIKKVEDSFNFLWRVEQARSFARRVTE